MPAGWGGTAEAYAATFAGLCAGPVDAVLDALDERMPSRGTLLDVGTGTGTLARAAAARGWATSASDPEPSMLAVATAVGGGVGYAAGALPDLPDPDRAFDAVTANFVVNHAHRPRAAVAELVRVARGAVALTIWPRRRTVLNGLWSGIVADAGATTPPGTTVAPEDDLDRTEEGLASVLADAGLRDVATGTLEWEWAVDPEELWAAVEAGVATIGTTYRAQDAPTRVRMRDGYRARAGELVGRDGLLRFASFGLLALGSRPE